MAWGYWSAASVSDRARSPRRHTSVSMAGISSFASSLPATSIIPPPPPAPSFHRHARHYQQLHPEYQYPQHRHHRHYDLQQHPQYHHYHHHHAMNHHPQQQCCNSSVHPNASIGGNEDYPISSLSRQSSFMNFRCRTPMNDDECSISSRPLTLQLHQGCSTAHRSGMLNALNTYPRSCPHSGTSGLMSIESIGRPGTLTAATSTSSLYDRGDKLSLTYGATARHEDSSSVFDHQPPSLNAIARTAECYLHRRPTPPPHPPSSVHSHQCSVHRDYASEDDDEPAEPTYATVFPNEPAMPGMPCQGEDRSIYRRGARRWRKLYRVNGHIFQAKRFNRRAFCAFCHDRIWGLGRQGFKCIQCKLLIHKKCHKLILKPCTSESVEPIQTDDGSGEPSIATTPSPDLPPENNKYFSDPALNRNSESVPVEDPDKYDENLEPGTQRQYSINDFELIRVIGRGSYAKVLMVELKKTKRIYAMKVIKKALVTDDEDIDWVQTEKHVFETASNHPFLVGLHSCFQTASRLFFVIEFVRGGDLMFHMQRQRRLPEEHARFYSAEISLALNFLHERGIIYRDLKLDNVLLDHEGHIKLTDYGMCKEGIRPGDTTSTFCGTPNYIAPEILRGEDYGFSVDWWALGVLLYEMLAGRSPFDIPGSSENPDQNTEDYLFQVILEKTIRIPRSLSVRASSVLKGFLNKNPADRLGCIRDTGFLDIVNHPFFKSVEWEMLEQKQVIPPYKPKLNSDRDLANFPPEFTDEPVELTPDNEKVIEKIDQSEFEGFEYVNPLLMSLEDCV